jgi:tetratricopeptide (TPR) repeat protein
VRRKPERGLLALIALLGAGCAHAAHDTYGATMAEASRAESAGRLDEARAAYDRAAAIARSHGDRDQSTWDAADVTQHQGDIAGATVRLDAIAKDATSEHQAEAAYRAAALRIDHGQEDEGWRGLEQVARRFPSSGVAHIAVRRLVAHADESGPLAAAGELEALRRDLVSTDVEPLVTFLRAKHVEAAGDVVAARDAYLQIADRWPYPHGSFFDDALWHASLLDERLGRYQAAVDDLERLVKVRETTSLMGSYERAKYVPSMLRIGALYRDRLHDNVRARGAFHRLYAGFDRSTRRAEALWLEASLWRDDGDGARSCETLAKLVREFPDSRYVPCSLEKCPALARPAKSAAPSTCRAYILKSETSRTDGLEPAL